MDISVALLLNALSLGAGAGISPGPLMVMITKITHKRGHWAGLWFAVITVLYNVPLGIALAIIFAQVNHAGTEAGTQMLIAGCMSVVSAAVLGRLAVKELRPQINSSKRKHRKNPHGLPWWTVLSLGLFNPNMALLLLSLGRQLAHALMQGILQLAVELAAFYLPVLLAHGSTVYGAKLSALLHQRVFEARISRINDRTRQRLLRLQKTRAFQQSQRMLIWCQRTRAVGLLGTLMQPLMDLLMRPRHWHRRHQKTTLKPAQRVSAAIFSGLAAWIVYDQYQAVAYTATYTMTLLSASVNNTTVFMAAWILRILSGIYETALYHLHP